MLLFFKADVPILQLFFIVVRNSAKIRHKNIISLLLGKVCRTHAAFAGTKDRYVFVFNHSLSQLQCYYCQYGQHDAEDPKTGYDLGFMKALFLIMVMYRRHQEYPAALAISFFGELEPRHL